jgi:Ca2+-binding RTX toxin-like protein
MPIQIGDELQVNVTTPDAQKSASITSLPDGGWLVTWQSGSQDGSGFGIYQQRYDKDGNKIGGEEVLVNDDTAGNQILPSVIALKGENAGGWVVAWQSDIGDGTGPNIRLRAFNPDGSSKSPMDDVVVNTFDAGQQTYPDITALADGGWVVTWTSDGQDGDGGGIYQRKYAKGGRSFGVLPVVNKTTTGSQFDVAVTDHPDGGWIVTWASNGQDGNSGGIYQQRYDKSGAKIGVEEERVNAATQDTQGVPHVAVLADGGWVMTWVSSWQDGDQEGIYQQRYAASGAKMGDEVRVNTFTPGSQNSPSITALSDGGWLVTWASYGQDGTSGGVYQQRYDKNGAKVGGETRVNDFTDGDQSIPDVAALADGGWIIAWESSGQDGASYGVYKRRYTPTDPTLTGTEGLSVRELAAAGTKILSLPQAGALDRLTYSLVSDVGGRFEIIGNELRVKNGVALDYERKTSHDVTVSVTDAAGRSATQTFTIKVANLSPTEKTSGTGGDDIVFGGGGRDTLSGGAGNDELRGNKGRDTLNGVTGNDVLFGGAANDKLTGGKGKDAFVFDTKPSSTNVDTITDFSHRDDSFRLDNAVFKALGKGSWSKPVKIAKDAFHVGATAADAEDRILYDKAMGSLSYDPDGEGGAGAVRFAVIKKGLSLNYTDFYVV